MRRSVFVLLALSPARALAQTGGAAALFASGDQAQAEGRNEDALRDCQAAVELLADSPKEQLGRAEFCVARAAAALDRVATAVEAASAAFRHIEESGSTARRYRADKEAASRMVTELTPRLSHLSVEIDPPEAREGAAIRVNGEPVPPALVGAPIPVDAGDFVVAVESEGFEPREVRGTVGVAERTRVEVHLVALPVPEGDGPEATVQPLRLLLGGSIVGGAAIQHNAETVFGTALVGGFEFFEDGFLGIAVSGATELENPKDTGMIVGGLDLSMRLLPMFWVGAAVGYGYSYWINTDPGTLGEVEGFAATVEAEVELRRISPGAFTIGTVTSFIIGDKVVALVPLTLGFRTW